MDFPSGEKIEVPLKIRLIIMVSCSCEPGHIYVSNVIPSQNRNIYNMSSKFDYGKRWVFVPKNCFLKLLLL